MPILQKSNILIWNQEEIDTIPTGPGVYVLRNFPSLNGIVYIGSSDDIKTRLQEHFSSREIPEVLFFDWYRTDTIGNAKEIEKVWIARYSPKYNYRIG